LYKVGIVGFGKIGKLRARLVEEHQHLLLDSVCDPVAEGPETCPLFRSYESVISRQPDIIFVCTSNDMIAEVTIAALSVGIHVFSEKPPGRTVAETEAMVAAEAANPEVKLKFGFNHRYHESVIESLRLVKSGRFGRLLSIRGIYGKSGALDYTTQWRNDRKVAGGGILLDQGIHMLDLMRLFCEDFEEVQSFVDTLFWDIKVEDNVFAILRNGKGQTGLLVSSAIQWRHTFSLHLAMEEGYLALDGILTNSQSYGTESLILARKSFADGELGQPPEEKHYFETDNSWNREVSEFVECVRENRPITVGGSRDALGVMRLIERIYQADKAWKP
jgi:predicted dehydrogenase